MGYSPCGFEIQSELGSNSSCIVLGTFFLYLFIPSLKVQVSMEFNWKATGSGYVL